MASKLTGPSKVRYGSKAVISIMPESGRKRSRLRLAYFSFSIRAMAAAGFRSLAPAMK